MGEEDDADVSVVRTFRKHVGDRLVVLLYEIVDNHQRRFFPRHVGLATIAVNGWMKGNINLLLGLSLLAREGYGDAGCEPNLESPLMRPWLPD